MVKERYFFAYLSIHVPEHIRVFENCEYPTLQKLRKNAPPRSIFLTKKIEIQNNISHDQ